MERYRNGDKYDPKRRSMFNLIEDEHRKNSNEIAKELKRRSYMENGHVDDVSYRDRLVGGRRYFVGNRKYLIATHKLSMQGCRSHVVQEIYCASIYFSRIRQCCVPKFWKCFRLGIL